MDIEKMVWAAAFVAEWLKIEDENTVDYYTKLQHCFWKADSTLTAFRNGAQSKERRHAIPIGEGWYKKEKDDDRK